MKETQSIKEESIRKAFTANRLPVDKAIACIPPLFFEVEVVMVVIIGSTIFVRGRVGPAPAEKDEVLVEILLDDVAEEFPV